MVQLGSELLQNGGWAVVKLGWMGKIVFVTIDEYW